MASHGAKSKKSNILRTVLLIFISLVIGFSVYSWNAANLVGNKMPMPLGVGMSVVLSGSMEPTLSVNDLVIIKESDSYEQGDIVIYQSGGILVIHRIIETDGDTVITKGDANNISDEPIEKSAIKGKLIASVPFVGLILRKIKSFAGVVVMLAAAVILLELSWRKEKQKDSDELEKIKEEIRNLKEGANSKGSEDA